MGDKKAPDKGLWYPIGEDEVWQAVKVIGEQPDGSITLANSQGSFNVPANKRQLIFPRSTDDPDLLKDDLIGLAHQVLGVARVEEVLRNRFCNGLPYTHLGRSTIVMNPCRELPIYSERFVDTYASLDPKLPPHIFHVAARAYRQMSEYSQSQAILLLGDIGSGKSQALQHSLDFFVLTAGGGDTVDTQVRTLPKLMRPFIGARTSTNPKKGSPSSTRAILDIVLTFDGEWISGGRARVGVLETRRAAAPQAFEGRNFDVFYEITLHPEAQKWLGGKKEFSLLQNAGLVDDEKGLKDTIEALGKFEIEFPPIVRLLAGLLLLAELKFTQKGSAVEAGPKDILDLAAKALGIQAGELQKGLTSGGDVPSSEDAMRRAVEDTYARLVGWLVLEANGRLKEDQGEEGSATIQLLELPRAGNPPNGMEDFDALRFRWLEAAVALKSLTGILRATPRDKDIDTLTLEQVAHASRALEALGKSGLAGALRNTVAKNRITPGKDFGVVGLTEELKGKTYITEGLKVVGTNSSDRSVEVPSMEGLPLHFTLDEELAANACGRHPASVPVRRLFEFSTHPLVAELYQEATQRLIDQQPDNLMEAEAAIDDITKLLHWTEETDAQPWIVICIRPNDDLNPKCISKPSLTRQIKYFGISDAIFLGPTKSKDKYVFGSANEAFLEKYKRLLKDAPNKEGKEGCSALIDIAGGPRIGAEVSPESIYGTQVLIDNLDKALRELPPEEEKKPPPPPPPPPPPQKDNKDLEELMRKLREYEKEVEQLKKDRAKDAKTIEELQAEAEAKRRSEQSEAEAYRKMQIELEIKMKEEQRKAAEEHEKLEKEIQMRKAEHEALEKLRAQQKELEAAMQAQKAAADEAAKSMTEAQKKDREEAERLLKAEQDKLKAEHDNLERQMSARKHDAEEMKVLRDQQMKLEQDMEKAERNSSDRLRANESEAQKRAAEEAERLKAEHLKLEQEIAASKQKTEEMDRLKEQQKRMEKELQEGKQNESEEIKRLREYQKKLEDEMEKQRLEAERQQKLGADGLNQAKTAAQQEAAAAAEKLKLEHQKLEAEIEARKKEHEENEQLQHQKRKLEAEIFMGRENESAEIAKLRAQQKKLQDDIEAAHMEAEKERKLNAEGLKQAQSNAQRQAEEQAKRLKEEHERLEAEIEARKKEHEDVEKLRAQQKQLEDQISGCKAHEQDEVQKLRDQQRKLQEEIEMRKGETAKANSALSEAEKREKEQAERLMREHEEVEKLRALQKQLEDQISGCKAHEQDEVQRLRDQQRKLQEEMEKRNAEIAKANSALSEAEKREKEQAEKFMREHENLQAEHAKLEAEVAARKEDANAMKQLQLQQQMLQEEIERQKAAAEKERQANAAGLQGMQSEAQKQMEAQAEKLRLEHEKLEAEIAARQKEHDNFERLQEEQRKLEAEIASRKQDAERAHRHLAQQRVLGKVISNKQAADEAEKLRIEREKLQAEHDYLEEVMRERDLGTEAMKKMQTAQAKLQQDMEAAERAHAAQLKKAEEEARQTSAADAEKLRLEREKLEAEIALRKQDQAEIERLKLRQKELEEKLAEQKHNAWQNRFISAQQRVAAGVKAQRMHDDLEAEHARLEKEIEAHAHDKDEQARLREEQRKLQEELEAKKRVEKDNIRLRNEQKALEEKLEKWRGDKEEADKLKGQFWLMETELMRRQQVEEDSQRLLEQQRKLQAELDKKRREGNEETKEILRQRKELRELKDQLASQRQAAELATEERNRMMQYHKELHTEMDAKKHDADEVARLKAKQRDLEAQLADLQHHKSELEDIIQHATPQTQVRNTKEKTKGALLSGLSSGQLGDAVGDMASRPINDGSSSTLEPSTQILLDRTQISSTGPVPEKARSAVEKSDHGHGFTHITVGEGANTGEMSTLQTQLSNMATELRRMSTPRVEGARVAPGGRGSDPSARAKPAKQNGMPALNLPSVGGDMSSRGSNKDSARSGYSDTRIARPHAHLHMALSHMAAELNAKRLAMPGSGAVSRAHSPGMTGSHKSLSGNSGSRSPSPGVTSASLSGQKVMPAASRVERDKARDESTQLRSVVEGLQAELAQWQTETNFWKECAIQKGGTVRLPPTPSHMGVPNGKKNGPADDVQAKIQASMSLIENMKANLVNSQSDLMLMQ